MLDRELMDVFKFLEINEGEPLESVEQKIINHYRFCRGCHINIFRALLHVEKLKRQNIINIKNE